ncbi:MAG: HlyD family secretion protein, partial [Flavisolibacter sp.]|nr:HlyD family secretion protein [Flavisolibacter sp.]
MNNKIFYITFALALIGCTKKPAYDASGTFETDELIVSAEQSGAIISLPFREGDTLQ